MKNIEKLDKEDEKLLLVLLSMSRSPSEADAVIEAMIGIKGNIDEKDELVKKLFPECPDFAFKTQEASYFARLQYVISSV